jgi:hypothetical protein
VTAHRVLQVARQPLELLLQPVVVKRRYPPAVVADGVVMMLTAGGDRLEAGAASADLDPLHEPHFMQQIDGSIDAGDAGIAAGSSESLVDLLGRETAVLAGEESHDGIACTARAVPSVGERRSRSPLPIRCRPVSHAGRLAAN